MDGIHITIKLFAQYRENSFKVNSRSYPNGTTVDAVVADIGIDIVKYPIGVLILNGRHVNGDKILKNKDTISIFPKVGGG